MSRRRDTVTADLFSVPQPAALIPGSMDYRQQVSAIVAVILSKASAAGLDRYEVAARASRLTGKDVSKMMLDGYCAESREEFNAPGWLLPVLEAVCSSTDFTDWLARVRGGKLITGSQTIDAEIGRLESEREQVSENLKQLKLQRRKVR